MLSYKQSNLKSVLLTCSTSLKKGDFSFSCFSFSPPARVQYSLLGRQGSCFFYFSKNKTYRITYLPPSEHFSLWPFCILVFPRLLQPAGQCKGALRNFPVVTFFCTYCCYILLYLYSVSAMFSFFRHANLMSERALDKSCICC